MENTYITDYPSVFMHTSNDITSEVSDELLYGTKLKIISNSGEYSRCETSYGYSGFIKNKYLAKNEYPAEAKPFVVTAPFCDVLSEPVYKYRPVLTLPRGSVVYSRHLLVRSNGFFSIIYRGHKCYVPTSSVKPLKAVTSNITENVSNFRKKLCDDALFYLGTPYRWGGKSSSGIDCSGLCFMTYFLNGLPLWRDAYADRRYVHEISPDKAKQGGMIYFKGHAAIYIGDGEYVHSSASAGFVTVNSLRKNSIIYRQDLSNNLVCFARSNFL